MRIEDRHVQVTRTALGDMHREGQYLSYKQFESHRSDSRTLKDIRENMTVRSLRGWEQAAPQQRPGWPQPTEAPAGTMVATVGAHKITKFIKWKIRNSTPSGR